MLQRGRKSGTFQTDPRIGFRDLPPQKPKPTPPDPPPHLEEPELRIWRHVYADFDLPTLTEADILAVALEAHARARLAREAVAREGMTLQGRDGQTKVHPLLAVERDARAAFLQGIKALKLELEPYPRGRPAELPPWEE